MPVLAQSDPCAGDVVPGAGRARRGCGSGKQVDAAGVCKSSRSWAVPAFYV